MRLIFLGAPGSGKGTQAKKLAQTFGLKHISTGDILRKAIREQTQLGTRAKEFVDAGRLVPDDVMLGIMKEELTRTDRGFIFDGFPRTTAQAEGLDRILKELGIVIDAVINLDVDDAVVIDRLEARRLCRNCGQEFNLKTRAPERDMVCDICGGELYRRPDDTADVIMKRLVIYREKTKPIEEFYRLRGLLATIDGSGSIDEVFGSVTEAVCSRR